MANGYLGKISAIVTANTSDYSAKLGGAARETAAFARSVQSEISRAMSGATKSLDSIYSPLQKLERSLQFARSSPLEFKGFEKVIRNIETLKARFSDLSQREISVILKTSGLADIGKFREAIQGLSSKNIELTARFGGLEQLKQLRQQIASDRVVLEVQARVESARARIESLDQQLANIKPVTVPVDASQIDAARVSADKASTAVERFLSKINKQRSGPERALDELITERALNDQALQRARNAQPAKERMRPQSELYDSLADAGLDEIKSLEKTEATLTKNIARLQELAKAARDAKEELENLETNADTKSVTQLNKELATAQREYKRAQSELSKTISARIGVDVDLADLDQTITAVNTAVTRGLDPAKLDVVIEGLREAGFDDASDQVRRIAASAELINKPFAAAMQNLAAMSLEVQGGFNPAIVEAQASQQKLNTLLQNSAAPVEDIAAAFDDVKNRVDRVIASMETLDEANRKVASLRTGSELQFARPDVAGVLGRSGEIGDAAAALPASAIAANPQIATRLQQIKQLSNEVAASYAAYLATPTDAAEQGLASIIAQLRRAQNETKNLIATASGLENKFREAAEFTVTGRPQNAEQARGVLARQESEIAGMNRGERQRFAGLLDDAAVAKARVEADPKALTPLLTVIEQIDSLLAERRQYKVDTEQAKDEAKRLKAEFESIAKLVLPAAGLDKLKESARAAAAAVERVGDAAEKARLQSQLTELGADIESVGSLQSPIDREDRAAELVGRADSIAGAAGRQADLDKRVADLKTRIGSVNDAWRLAVGGLPQTEEQIEQSISRIVGDIGKLSVADRISFDPLVQEILALAQQGDKVDELTEKLKKLDETAKRSAQSAELIERIRKMPASREQNSLLREALVLRPPPGGTPPPDFDSRRANLELRASRLESLGAPVGSASRQFDQLRAKIISVQGSLESLPAPLQARFIPEIARIRSAFASLPINATAAEIKKVADEARKVGASIDLASEAAKRFGSTYAQAFQSSESNAAVGKLRFLQNALIASGASSAQAEAALEKLRLTYEKAASSAGGFANAANRAAIASAEQNAVGAVAGATGQRAGKLAEDFKRAGDVGRGGADKWSLALNQAAFAVDDFLSSTGGVEFKLRAISNNITQLAFVLGGTKGLFIGLGAVIGGQAAVMLMKWVNGGKTAEDQTKALNESLARQKSLVEELAQAFRSLGESVTRGVLSSGAQSAADFKRQVDEIRRKQRELSGERAASTDAQVQKERALQNAKKKELENETNIGRRIALNQEIQAAERRDRALTRGLAVQPIPQGEAVARAIREAAVREIEGFEASVPFGFGRAPQTQIGRGLARTRARELRGIAGGVPAGSTPEDIQAQIKALEKAIAVRAVSARSGFLPNTRSRFGSEDIEEIGSLIARLRNGLDRALNEAAIGVFKSAAGAGETIRRAQEDVAEAIRRGVPSAAEFQRQLDDLGNKLNAATDELDRAENESGGDPQLRQQAIEQARQQVAQVQAQQAAVEARAREVRLGRTFGGERTTAALSRIEGDERFQADRPGISASLRAAIDAETAAQTALEAARRRGVQAEQVAAEQKLLAAQKASEVVAALAEAVIAMQNAVARARRIGDNAIQRSEQLADAAQRDFELNPDRGGARENRDGAERRLIDNRAEVEKAQAALDQRTVSAVTDQRVQAVNRELEAITQRRKDLEAKAATGGGLDVNERKELIRVTNREIDLRRDLANLLITLTAAERAHLDAINNRIAAENKAAEMAARRNEQADVFGKAQREAAQLADGAEQQAEAARQRFFQNPTRENEAIRKQAEEDAIAARARGQEIEDRLESTRRKVERSGEVADIDGDIAMNERFIQKAMGNLANAGGMDADERKELEETVADLQKENRELRARRVRVVDKALDDVRADLDKERVAQAERDRAIRGRDLGLTEREKARKEMMEGAGGDINARAAEMRRQGEDPTAFLRQAIANQMEQIAPMLYQFQQNRENAILQGPSRAALKFNDVSTSQGAAELTRLLRGDDPAKDVNLAELRKQTQKFDELINVVKQQNAGVLL